jgi:hypothetical protein
MSQVRVGTRDRAVALLAALIFVLPSCGGGSTTPPSTLPPVTTTTTPASVADPSFKVSTDRKAGVSPLSVGFDLCASRDGSGGTALTYLADFEGEGLTLQGGCGFNHVYRSNGVTVRDSQLCVKDAGGRSACGTVKIKSYVAVDISVNKTTGCDATIIASARLLTSSVQSLTAGGGARTLGDVDRVQFEAFNAAGQSLDKREGTKQGNQWVTGTWKVNDTTKLRVKATVFSAGVAGDDTPEGDRPACGS